MCPHCGYDLRQDEPITIGDFSYDPRRGLFYKGAQLYLTPAFAIIIASLMKANGKVITRDALLGRLGSDECSDNLVRQQVSLLRKKFEQLDIPCHVETVWGRGFRWDAGHHHGSPIRKLAA